MARVIGVVYPIPVEFVPRLFDEGRNVFVKYLPRITNISLQKGLKILFYVSKSNKQVVGEGVVSNTEFLTPDEAISKYGEKVFLSKDELAAYTAMQPSRDSSKKMLVVVLTKLKKYKKGIVYPRPITMAGEYLTKERYNQLVG